MKCACEWDNESKKFSKLCAFHHVHLERDRAPELLKLEQEVDALRTKLQRVESALREKTPPYSVAMTEQQI